MYSKVAAIQLAMGRNYIYIYIYICSTRLGKLAGCITGYPVTQSVVRMEYLNLHLSGCITG